jgi:hypothetical protein
MIWIVLAGGLGVANFITVALLFRRDRQLSRQLSDMRAERNSEWILHALKSVPDNREQAAPAANGDYQPPAVGPQPVRRKKHLGLFLGGGSAAALASLGLAARRAWQRHPHIVVAGALGAVTAAAVGVALTGVHPGSSSGGGSPPTWPPTTATVTATRSRGSSPPPAPAGSPPASSSPGLSPPASPTESRSPASPPAPPGGEASSGSGAQSSSPSSGTSRPPGRPTTAGPSTTPSPPPTSGIHVPCLDVEVAPILELAICLAGGR